jgi:hypothetical protein
VYDAWGKLPAGLAFGNTVTYGNYDQCMSIQQPMTTQSCFLPLIENSRPPVPVDNTPLFSSSVCVPAVCDPSRVPILVNEFVQRFNLSVPAFDGANSCQSDARPSFTGLDWTAIIIFSLFGCLLIGSTVYDVVMKERKSKETEKKIFHMFYISTYYLFCYLEPPSNVLRSFSVYSNANRLLSCEQSKSPDNLQCLNGLRVVSIVWVVFLHRHEFTLFQPNMNAAYQQEWIQSFYAMIWHGGYVAVDTFLVMSGVLVALQFFKEREQK